MKEPKDIFNHFKDNEYKLNQRPTDNVWNRLEGRLDNHERPNRRIRRAPRLIRNWLSMAGVFLVLVACISALSLMFRNQTALTAMKEKSATPRFVLEEIGVYSDQNKIAEDISAYAKSLNRLNTNPILEGDASKELRVQKAVLTNHELKTIADKKTKSSINQNKLMAIAQKDNATDNSSDLKSSTINSKKEIESVASPISDTSIQSEEFTASTADEVVHETEVTTAIVMTPSVNDFRWLLGKWESSLPNKKTAKKKKRRLADLASKQKEKQAGVSALSTKSNSPDLSIEEWKQIDANTISGNGYLIIDGEQKFVEQMRIEQIEEEMYYILSLDPEEKQRRYKLKSFSKEEMTFENEQLNFPNQVILKYLESENKFIVLLKNNTPTQLEPKLKSYFQYRNEISSEQIKRVMNKVE